MNFYGLWISSTNQEYINECIKTGIWRKESYPNEENKELERKKIRELEIGSKVFLYYDAGTVAIRETKFSNYLSTNIFDHSKTIVKVKCPAVGVVKSKNEDDVSLEIEWDKSYVATEWYVYFRQDGIWVFNNAKKEALRDELYEIVFNHKALDFKWWSENLNWSRKKLMILNIEEAFKEWLKDKVESLAPLSSYPIALKKYIPEELKNLNEEKYTNLFECTDIEYLKSVRNRLLKNGDLHSFNTETQSRVPSAALSKYIEFLEEKNTNPQADKETRANNAQPLNQILYGPPGTGKTYHTIDKALEIIDGKVPKSRAEAKERFETLKKAGQIEFVTFHQSYGYEEFVEGVKADVKSETIRYVIEDGIFKSLSDKARKHFEDSQKSQSEIASEISQKDKIGDFLNKALEDEKVFQKTKGGKFGIKDLTEKSIILYSEDSNYNENSITLDVEEFYKIVNANIEFKTSRQIAQEVFGISNQRQKDTYYLSLYKEYKKVPFTETKINADMIENKNYLLIIDEINRGNISKIFGELITLIEESKRLGNDEAMEVTLPYSGEKFGVPKNLYIIGTMNTADRSIALMDTALRRRFEFTEMMPDYDVIREEVGDNGMIDGLDIVSMLEKINKRIEYLYDRDHTIGHAYFIDVEDKATLDSVMRNKVIPLLQEYFYDDWEKIALILNDGFIEKTVQDVSKLFDSMDDEYIEEDKYTYSIASDFHKDAYRKIYGKIEQIQAGESHE